MMTDSFPITVIDDVILQIQTKMVVKDAVNVNFGGNPAAEGGEDEGVEDKAEKVVDVIDAFRLQSLGPYDKKSALAWLKGYLKAVKEHLDTTAPERSAIFQERSSRWVKEVLLKRLGDFVFYSGPSFNVDGGLAMLAYEGDNVTPTVYLFKDGLVEEKC
mmetsp:Transcript_46206/g.122495  ORF Transcript_46206/g.122495 Transcript_46206/m.122495 type:complete len:159 (-) Transcript_46206:33-509(-)